jgi:hypothetical protein
MPPKKKKFGNVKNLGAFAKRNNTLSESSNNVEEVEDQSNSSKDDGREENNKSVRDIRTENLCASTGPDAASLTLADSEVVDSATKNNSQEDGHISVGNLRSDASVANGGDEVQNLTTVNTEVGSHLENDQASSKAQPSCTYQEQESNRDKTSAQQICQGKYYSILYIEQSCVTKKLVTLDDIYMLMQQHISLLFETILQT